MEDQFSRTRLLIGDEGIEKLKRAHIAVFGAGGVGGNVIEALARAGIGAIDIIDNDTVCLSNINRQIFALHSNIGKYKADAARERVLDINPSCNVNAYKVFYMPDTADMFDFSGYDYIIDAIDTVTAKIELIKRAYEKNIPIISSMGTGNKLDPCMLEISDIYKTSVCPLARVMRRELKSRGIKKLKVLYSKEPPIPPKKTGNEESNKKVVGSVSFVPPAAGLIIAGEVIRDLLKG